MVVTNTVKYYMYGFCAPVYEENLKILKVLYILYRRQLKQVHVNKSMCKLI